MTMTESVAVTPQPATEQPDGVITVGYSRFIDNLWRGCTQPWLPIICTVFLLLTVLVVFVLPQLPAQLSEDPAAAARWLNSMAAEYGALGSAFSGLGLFRAMNSLLWRLLTVLLSFLLLLHLLRFWLLEKQIAAAEGLLNEPASNGEVPLRLPVYPAVQRTRSAVPSLPQTVYEKLQARLRITFDSVQQWQNSPNISANGGEQPETMVVLESASENDIGHENRTGDASAAHEFRILAIHGRRELRLRMVLLAGGMIAMLALWMLNVAGWRIQTEPLTPLERFRDEWHNVAIDFRLEGNIPVIIAQQAEDRTSISITSGSDPQNNASLRSGAVQAISGPPALLIQSLSEGAELKRPDGASSMGVGLLFPSPGSEETLILPQQESVLRIVRRTDAAPLTFAIEAIQASRGQTTTIQTNRFEINADETRTIKLGETEVQLRFLPLYSRKVEVTSLPGLWLLWLALPFTAIGLLGLRKKTSFLLAQIAPWPIERSVVVTQSSETLDLGSESVVQ